MDFELPNPAAVQLPAVITRNQRTVERSFWKKLLKVAGRIPFAEDLAAAYFCAVDPLTPGRVKGVLLAALAYFVIPTDIIPDFIAGFGFTDDAAVLATAISLVSGHIKPRHYERAHAARHVLEPPAE
ncbi:MAG: DUF1232 domain-containing protein [Alphaproteobacteria bacterium]|nr:DUF1232 domain-containing protein [Alphaproteobacteria bacterium]MDE2111046.1 DUF1232 domain-containing protein [Alphaproteobacteria bacterium]MDE2494746.1 DUF1232 domain-containing protein [Alphaproteobacteria bacterium]